MSKFKDITNEHWAYEAIEEFSNRGIIKCYEDGSFKPNGDITRAEAAAIFARLSPDFDESKQYEHSFSDVSSGAWYEKYVAFCYKKGIISGYPDGTYQPDKSITRAEVAVIFNRFKEVE